MASSTYNLVPIKRLAEFLQEEQEPYILDMCRSKGHVKSSKTGDNADNSKQKSLDEALYGSCTWNLMKRVRPHGNSSRIMKLLSNKFNAHFGRNSEGQTEESASISSFYDSNATENSRVQNSEVIRKHQCRHTKARKQFILRVQQFPVASTLHKTMENTYFTRREAETLSSEIPIATKSTDYFGRYNKTGFSKYVKDRTTLVQTKQLLIDYANEATSIHRNQGSGKSVEVKVVPDGQREIIYKKIFLWRKQLGDHKKIAQVSNSNISTTLEEWSNFQHLNKDTVIEIGDSILDDIVTELINFN